MTASTPDIGEAAFPRAHSGRLEAFIDAVVAIAMTLLILPLLEATTAAVEAFSAADGEGPSVGEYLRENGGQIFAFVLSFVLIAVFWMMHHRVFRSDTPATGTRSMVNFAWMITIVIMPVTTAMVGSFRTDRLLIAAYIGDLTLCSWLLLAVTAVEIRGRIGAGLAAPGRSFLAVFWAQAALYTLALVLSIAFPAIGFFSLFLLLLTSPTRRLLITTVYGRRSVPDVER